MMVNLLPCPFCGTEAGYIDDDSYGHCHVGCNNEECLFGHATFNKNELQEAIKWWNMRAI